MAGPGGPGPRVVMLESAEPGSGPPLEKPDAHAVLALAARDVDPAARREELAAHAELPGDLPERR